VPEPDPLGQDEAADPGQQTRGGLADHGERGASARAAASKGFGAEARARMGWQLGLLKILSKFTQRNE